MKEAKITMRGETAEVLVYDVIGEDPFFGGGISAKTFREQVKGVRAKAINLRINSPGGSVTEGAAMLSTLDEFPGRIEVDVDGIAASAASAIAMAGDHIRISSTGLMMIHNPYAGVHGNADEMRRMADLLDRVKGQLVDAYARHAKVDSQKISDWMDAETWFTGQEAVAAGLAHEAAAPVRVAALAGGKKLLARLGYKHSPPAFRAAMEMPMHCLEVGDRVMVAGTPHMPGQEAGIVRQVCDGPAYGVEFDSAPGEVHQWYVGSELMLEDPLEEETEPMVPGMPMDSKKAWDETRRRKAMLDLLASK